jgi:translation initiation factor 3 subunit A
VQELTKEAIMELALNEQLKERQEMEKKLQRLAKTMDYLERAKRQEEAPLIEQAFEKRLEEEKILHEQEQLVSRIYCSFIVYAVQIHVSTLVIYFCLQREIELSKQHHAGDLQEKNRLSRMLEHKVRMLLMFLLLSLHITMQVASVWYIFNL